VDILQHAERIILPPPMPSSVDFSGKPGSGRALPILAARCLFAEQINGIISKARKVGV